MYHHKMTWKAMEEERMERELEDAWERERQSQVEASGSR